MKIDLEFAELCVPLFLGGKNFSTKLTASTQTLITLIYCRDEKELWVTYNDKTAIIPTSNVVSMTPRNEADISKQSVPTLKREQGNRLNKFETNPLAKAQVSSPMDSDGHLG